MFFLGFCSISCIFASLGFWAGPGGPQTCRHERGLASGTGLTSVICSKSGFLKHSFPMFLQTPLGLPLPLGLPRLVAYVPTAPNTYELCGHVWSRAGVASASGPLRACAAMGHCASHAHHGDIEYRSRH